MYDIINCKDCGKIFKYPGFGYKICPECKKDDESNLKKIRDILYEEKNCNISKLSELTNIPEKTILRYIDEGLIQINGLSITRNCKSCGQLIVNEDYCPHCKNELLKDLNKIKGYYVGPKVEVKSQMRFLNRNRNKK